MIRGLLNIRRHFATSTRSGPLDGVTIVDATRILAGPFCTMLLSDLGARVIKVEHPKGGDEVRRWGPPFVRGGESCYYLAINRNKESITVNLTSTKGQEIVRRLVSKADVFVENFMPRKLAKYSLDYDALSKLNDGLIYCSISGFGTDGPYGQRAGYDVMAASIGGLMGVTGPKDGEPCKAGVAMTDLSTGLYAHGAIMAALLHRAKTGKGQLVGANLLATQVSCMANLASSYLNAGVISERRGTAHESVVPYQSFKCRDGMWLTVGAGSDHHFKKFSSVILQPDLGTDPRFITNADRVRNRDELMQVLCEVFAEKTLDEWLSLFDGSGLPYGPVNSMDRVFADPQVVHLGMERSVEHPIAGTVKFVGPAVRYSEAVCDVRSAPPTLGQHTDSVLSSLGYSIEEIAGFRAAGDI
ncbi:unnamed protein product [Notodromas monacha]|uniref:Uncharacterized protein n=1 Tax=Notodromas monacha TaxID=399045 RepID=A0A7R9C2Z7_9CRUS|nr:unnamed protein product [Notodromas monacha]CAD7285206.1 unnamed protein product [Notodromas monacha]CAG0913580.1 unnamed protein product [Notodromas monacha]CAG0925358.1 unnamed protein product [Notodromas monacha]